MSAGQLILIQILVKMAENGSLQQEQRQQWQAEAAKHQEYENNLVSLRKDIVKNHEKIIGIMQDLHGQVRNSLVAIRQLRLLINYGS